VKVQPARPILVKAHISIQILNLSTQLKSITPLLLSDWDLTKLKSPPIIAGPSQLRNN
jgi:hypothetical protein